MMDQNCELCGLSHRTALGECCPGMGHVPLPSDTLLLRETTNLHLCYRAFLKGPESINVYNRYFVVTQRVHQSRAASQRNVHVVLGIILK